MPDRAVGGLRVKAHALRVEAQRLRLKAHGL